MIETGKKIKASDPLMEAVRQSFSAPHFVTLSEVRDSTGFDSKRSADALALGMFRSRGRLLFGFEFKVSRSDWLCELRRPDKSESWFQYCDHWGLIVPDASIVKTEELPVGWGFGVPYAKGVKWIIKPPALSPAPLDRHALCALVFRTIQGIERDQEQIKADAAAEAYARAEKERADDRASLIGWREMVNSFEAATGLSIRLNFRDPEKAKKLGDAIRLLASDRNKIDVIARHLESQASLFDDEANRARERAAALLDGLAALNAGQAHERIVPSSPSQYEELMDNLDA